jgi:plastocyanin
MSLSRRSTSMLVLLFATTTCACGGGGSKSPTTPSGGGSDAAATITITSSGASPQRVTITNGGRVMFINNDSRVHFMASDPHPSHEDCPELNSVGVLNPGERRESANLVVTRACGFHDHDNPGTQSLQGTVTIQ